eukprot:1719320-Prymnesium_polylepis.1
MSAGPAAPTRACGTPGSGSGPGRAAGPPCAPAAARARGWPSRGRRARQTGPARSSAAASEFAQTCH